MFLATSEKNECILDGWILTMTRCRTNLLELLKVRKVESRGKWPNFSHRLFPVTLENEACPEQKWRLLKQS